MVRKDIHFLYANIVWVTVTFLSTTAISPELLIWSPPAEGWPAPVSQIRIGWVFAFLTVLAKAPCSMVLTLIRLPELEVLVPQLMNLSLFLRVNLSIGIFPELRVVLSGPDFLGFCSEARLLFSIELVYPTAECFEQNALNSTYKREAKKQEKWAILTSVRLMATIRIEGLTLGCLDFPHISIWCFDSLAHIGWKGVRHVPENRTKLSKKYWKTVFLWVRN